MSLSIDQLTQWHLPVTPINYHISYDYVSNKNNTLNQNIQQQLSTNNTLDQFFVENLYKEHILNQSKFRDEMFNDLDNVLTNTQKNHQQSSSSVQVFINELDENISNTQTNDIKQIRHALAELHKASIIFKSEQQQLSEQLQASQEITQKLQSELKDVRKEIYLDPLTNLYNHKAMDKYVKGWLNKDPNKKIAVIALEVEHFSEFTQRFGSLLGDVILSKIASKISSYVNKSGLPVRTGSKEFIILLPDVDMTIAKEIAEKIKLGVKKLRFVSVQSGIRLPQMSLSLNVGEKRPQEPLNVCIQRVQKNGSSSIM